jgi:hypothetical protein
LTGHSRDARSRDTGVVWFSDHEDASISTIDTKDGTQICYTGKGQPVVFSHGWPLSADAFETDHRGRIVRRKLILGAVAIIATTVGVGAVLNLQVRGAEELVGSEALCLVRGSSTGPPQAAFAAANEVAMSRMKAEMDIKASGDIDRDFAAMMIPHHQGAIEMAIAELRYGRNEQLRRIAQEIVIDQQQEIEAMKFALHEGLASPAPAPTGGAARPIRGVKGVLGVARACATVTQEVRK